MHIIFVQFPVLHFGLAHSGSQPFNYTVGEGMNMVAILYVIMRMKLGGPIIRVEDLCCLSSASLHNTTIDSMLRPCMTCVHLLRVISL